MIVAIFFILDQDNKESFLKKRFLLTDFKSDIVLKMPFLTTMNNADIDF